MKSLIFTLLLCWPHVATPNTYTKELNDTIDAWNSGYEARWILKKPMTSNPYKKGTSLWEIWNDSWQCMGWMPDLRDIYPPEEFN